MASHRGNSVVNLSRSRNEVRAAKWRRRFRRFALTPWHSSRIVGSIYNFFRSSAEAARAVKAATGSQLVGLGYSRQLRLEALEARQLLSANRYVNDYWIVTTNNVGGPGADAGDIVMSDTGAGDAPVAGLVFGTDAFDTIPAAVAASGDGVGDTVTVLKGSYSGTVNLNKSLSLRGQSAADVLINAGGSPGVAVAAGKTALVDDLTFQTFGVAGTGVSVKGNLTLTDSVINGGLIGIDVDGATNGHLTMSGTKVTGATVFGVNVGGGAGGSAAIDHSEISIASGAAADVNVSDGSATINTSKLATTSNTSKGLLVTSSGAASINASDLSGIVSGGKAISNATVGAYVVDASDNWWGTAATSDTAVLALTEGNVDITPYRDAATTTDLDGGAVGFVGSNSLLHVTLQGAQYGSTGRIQEGVNLVLNGGLVDVLAGTYTEAVSISGRTGVTLQGAGYATTSIVGPHTSPANTATIDIVGSTGILVTGFTITRNGNNTTDWATNGMTYGVRIDGGSANTVQNNLITGNRSGVDLRNVTSGNTIQDNRIDSNRTGMIIWDLANNNLIQRNEITNNWTAGVLFLDTSNEATGNVITNNNISGNWYTQVEDRRATGAARNVSGNWFGTNVITVTATEGGEPGYASLIPTAYGGTSTPPGSPRPFIISGSGSAKVDYTPWLDSGADANPGLGFNGDFSILHVDDNSPQSGATGRITEGIGLLTGGGTLLIHSGAYTENVDTSTKVVTLVPTSAPTSSTGQITLTGNLTLDSNDTLQAELNGTAPALYDSFVVNGTVALGGASLVLSRGFNPFPGDEFLLIDNDGADPVSGIFAGYNDGDVITIAGIPFTINYDGGTGNDVTLTVAVPNTVWANDTWTIANDVGPMGLSVGDTVDSNTGLGDASVTGKIYGYNAFSEIQTAINAVSVGGTVNVLAGTYVEQVVVTKKINLLGANATADPTDGGVRGPESKIIPDISNPDPNVSPYPTLIYVNAGADNSTIKGFLLDGDNPGLTSGVLLNGADIDAEEGIASYEGVGGLTVSNNIIRNLSYAGVDFYNYNNGGAATSGNVIANNLIENLGGGGFGYGIGVLIYNNFYADVIDNDITGVRVGVQTGNFSQANPGTTASISGNEISAMRTGIFYNLHYSSASPFTVANNVITATNDPSAPVNARWFGMLISSQQTAVSANFNNNTIDGSASSIATKAGYTVWNTPTTGALNINGGSVTGVDYGVWVNNYEGYLSNGDNTDVTVNGVEITASDIGVYVLDSPANTNGSSVHATIQNNTKISGASVAGIKVEGADASADITGNDIYANAVGIQFTAGGGGSFGGALLADGNNFNDATDNGTDILIDATAGAVTDAGNNAFAGDSFYIDNQSTQNINATGDTFDEASNYRIEDKMFHKVDDLSKGLVTWVAGNLYVTTPVMGSTDSSIQRAIDAASAGNTVNVEAGPYAIPAAISVNKQLTLLGAQNGVDARTRSAVPESVIDASAVAGFPTSAIVIGSLASGVVIDGFTIENVSGSGATTVGAIYMTPGSNSTTVRNNIIQNNHAGIFVANNSAMTATLIERNLFIDNNAPGAVSGTGIYADEYTTGGGLTNVVIQDNKFTNTSFVENAWAIGMSNTGATAFTDIDVLNNTVTNSGRGFYFFGTQNATVQGNSVDGANNHYALGIFSGATAATLNFSITGNTFKNAVGGSGILMDTGTGIVANNNILTGNKYGAKIEDGSISMAGNTLTGNVVVGIQVSNGALVDAGGGSLGSTGGNILTGYTGTGGNYAIEDLNLVGSMQPDVYAKFNDFGPYANISIIENYVFDDTDDPLNTKVIFTGALNQQLPAPNVVFVDDGWVGSVLGVDKDGGGGSLGDGAAFGYDQFATIQDAINAVAATGTIWVYAGNYAQQLNIDKALSLKSANTGTAGNAMRDPEAVIKAGAAPTDALIEVSAADVTIDGFKIDGNDQATRAIRVNEVNGAVIQNNIITAAVRGVQYNGAAAGNSGGVVSRNLIENMTTGAGDSYGVLAFDSSYASVTNNEMTGLDVGIFEQYFYQPNAGDVHNTISGNVITAALLGYGTNERSAAASTTDLSGNTYTITGGTGSVGVQLYNIYKTGGVTLTNESITGADIGVYAYVNGGSVSITGGSIDGNGGSRGVWVTNYLADFSTYATSYSSVASSLGIHGVNISDVTTGVYVEDANADFAGNGPGDDATGAVNVTIDTDTNIYNTGTAVHVTGPLANAAITGNDNSIHNNVVGIDVDGGTATITGNHFFANTTAIWFHNGGGTGMGSVASNIFDGGMSADNATDLLIQNAGVAIGANNMFAGDTFFIDNQSTTDYDLSSNGTTFDEVNNFRIEDKIHHVVDIDLALTNGLVTWVAGNIFVTNGGTDHSIQRGVDAASIGNTVNVEAGTYAEDLLIGTQGVKVIGAGAASTIIDYAGKPGNNNGGVYIAADDVELRSLTVTQSAIDATPRYGVKVDFVDGVVIDGVTITNSYRTGLDLHGVTNVTVNNLVSQNNGGAGIFMTDVKGAALSNITTANNPWAGVSIATSGQYAPLGTNGIIFSGTNSFGESNSANGGLQLEMYRYSTNTPYPISWSSNPADGADVTIQAADFGYALSGSSFDVGTNTHGYVRFYKTLSQAENAAAGSPDHIDGNVAGLGTRYIQEADDSNGLPNSGPTDFYVFDNVGNTMSVQAAVNAALAGDTINVAAGTFVEDVTINKNNLTLKGAGSSVTSLIGAIGGAGSTITVAANNADISGFTITRDGNTVSQWNDPLNTAGIAIQGQSLTGTVIHDNILTGNRTAIDINNSNGHTIRNNVIDFNRTGLIFRNQTDNLLVTENFITNNWTVGVLFLDGSGGTNMPVQTAANSQFFNNNISGNWYGQVVDRQSGGSLPAPGTNIKDFRRNWLGTTTPVVTTANSTEPGYAAQIPVAYGGMATPPGGQPDIAGPASANIDITPFLTSGTDTNVETTLGRGTFGFQGNLSQLGVTISGPAAVNEGAAYTLTLNPTNPGSLNITSWDITWGDGSPTQIVSGNPLSVNHIFVEGPSSPVITAVAHTTYGPANSNSVPVTVNNVVPTPSSITWLSSSINENQVASASLTISDPGTQDTFSVQVNWGEGTPDVLSLGLTNSSGTVGGTTYTWTAATRALALSHQYLDDNPTGTPSDTYTLTVKVADDDMTGNFAGTLGVDYVQTTANLTVNNVAPTAVAYSLPASVNEGSLATINITGQTDVGTLDTFTYSYVVKKNGSTVATSGGFIGSNSFNFTPDDMDPGFTWTVEVQAKDDDGGLSPVNVQTLNVVDVAPTVNIVSLTSPINENTSTTLVFNLVDPGLGDLAATGQVSINWGDGSTPTIINSGADIAALQAGGTVSRTHTYVDDNPPGTSSDVYSITFTSVQVGSPNLTFTNMALAGTSLPRTVTVNNIAPTGLFLTSTPTVSAGDPVSVNWILQSDVPADVTAGLKYTYFIDANLNNMLDSGEEILPAATYGDGTYGGSTLNDSVTIPGSYFSTPGVKRVASQIRDDDGGVTTQFVDITVLPTTFRVTSLVPTDTGFIVTFNRAADTAPVNLYAGRLNSGPITTDTADVTLVGSGGVGNVRGSIVWSADRTSFEFIKTGYINSTDPPTTIGGVLAAANYTVTIESGDTAFQDQAAGEDLDGDNNLIAGGNYIGSFTVTPYSARVVSIPDFARGSSGGMTPTGQTIKVPLDNGPAGIPISINNGFRVAAVDLDVVYDPALIDITSVVAGADTAGWTVTANLTTPGRAIITLFSSTGLSTGVKEIARLIAKVDDGAAYGASEVLRIENLSVHDVDNLPLAAKGDSALHKAIFVGDATANGTYTGQDASWIAEVRVNTFTGFGEYPTTDPIIVADVTGSRTIDGLDSTWVSQKGLAPVLRPEIPNIPAGGLPVIAGVDPTIAIPLNILASPGHTVHVPLNITDSAAGLNGFNVLVDYDTTKLDLPSGLNAGGITVAGMFASEGGWSLDTYVDDSTGHIGLSFYRIGNSTSGAGQIADIAFTVSPSASGGATPLDVNGPTNDPPFSFTHVDGSILIDAAAPTVNALRVSSSAWTNDFKHVADAGGLDVGYIVPGGASQLTTLPWVNVNKLVITFSEDVIVSQGDLILRGVNTADYTSLINGFSYNAPTRTATWMLSSNLPVDKYLAVLSDNVKDAAGNALDGNWTNGGDSYPSGNGTAGGRLEFRFNVVPGDANRSGDVQGSDVGEIRLKQFQSISGGVPSGGYSIYHDLDGNGVILGSDVGAAQTRQFTSLPAGEPTPPMGSGAVLLQLSSGALAAPSEIADLSQGAVPDAIFVTVPPVVSMPRLSELKSSTVEFSPIATTLHSEAAAAASLGDVKLATFDRLGVGLGSDLNVRGAVSVASKAVLERDAVFDTSELALAHDLALLETADAGHDSDAEALHTGALGQPGEEADQDSDLVAAVDSAFDLEWAN
ncbi:MAG: right-handed parallel beta-helix repeat-containing protein [Pirellulales bacterium]